MKSVLIALFITFSLVACESGTNSEALQKIANEMNKTLEQTKESLRSVTSPQGSLQQRTSEEVSKLFSIEYKLEELPNTSTTKAVEDRLTSLGKERWDCFHIEPRALGIRIYCKRVPTSYLKYLPGLIF